MYRLTDLPCKRRGRLATTMVRNRVNHIPFLDHRIYGESWLISIFLWLIILNHTHTERTNNLVYCEHKQPFCASPLFSVVGSRHRKNRKQPLDIACSGMERQLPCFSMLQFLGRPAPPVSSILYFGILGETLTSFQPTSKALRSLKWVLWWNLCMKTADDL
jgi:hypothetical protein